MLGLTSLANQRGGIYVGGTATNNLIGGVPVSPSQPRLNIVSGNAGYGVTLDAGTTDISVIGNYLGLDPLGYDLPNATGPILVNPGSTGDTIAGNQTPL